MRSIKSTLSATIASAILLLLILDPQTASTGAVEGIDQCMKVIVPSLFPFFIVTTYMNASLMGLHVPGIRSIGKLLHIPSGAETLLLLGLTGGYPVGAQIIGDAYREGKISERTGKIMLGYCSNAGPAFIFGVAGTLFQSPSIPFVLWLVHIISAVVTGLLLPRPEHEKLILQPDTSISLVQALQKSIYICLTVCGWVITFKTIMAYIEKWLLADTQGAIAIAVTGILELSNGCLKLTQLHNEPYRFIICAAFLAFGGICVAMQTSSVTEKLGLGFYIPGKVMQTCISVLAAIPLSYVLFADTLIHFHTAIIIILICIGIVIAIKALTKKVVEIPSEIMYNSL